MRSDVVVLPLAGQGRDEVTLPFRQAKIAVEFADLGRQRLLIGEVQLVSAGVINIYA